MSGWALERVDPSEPKPVGSAEWADWWEQQWGRENLDAITVEHLDRMRARCRGCEDAPVGQHTGAHDWEAT